MKKADIFKDVIRLLGDKRWNFSHSLRRFQKPELQAIVKSVDLLKPCRLEQQMIAAYAIYIITANRIRGANKRELMPRLKRFIRELSQDPEENPSK